MKTYYAVVHKDEDSAFGVTFPDLPGCFSAGDSLDEAIMNTKEAIELWMESVIEEGTPIPAAASITKHQADPDFAGWIWALVEVDLSRLSGKAKRVNITLPERVLSAIDQAAARFGDTRSGLLAKAALEYVDRHSRL